MKLEVDPQAKLAKTLQKYSKKVGDLTIPLTLISQQWFKSNIAIFSLQSKGKYTDLSPIYKERKKKDVGFAYPIMKRGGDLERSLTNPEDGSAVNRIINRLALTVGTSVPYAIFHQSKKPRTKMPFRPVVLFGNEQIAPNALKRRVRDWEKMIGDHVRQVTGAK